MTRPGPEQLPEHDESHLVSVASMRRKGISSTATLEILRSKSVTYIERTESLGLVLPGTRIVRVLMASAKDDELVEEL